MNSVVCMQDRKIADYCIVFAVRPPYSPRLIVLDNPNVVFLICDTKVRHELLSSEYNIRRETCAAAADKMGKPSLRDASIHDLESMQHICLFNYLLQEIFLVIYLRILLN